MQWEHAYASDASYLWFADVRCGHTYDGRYVRYWHHGGRYLPHGMRAPTAPRIAGPHGPPDSAGDDAGRPGPAILIAAT